MILLLLLLHGVPVMICRAIKLQFSIAQGSRAHTRSLEPASRQQQDEEEDRFTTFTIYHCKSHEPLSLLFLLLRQKGMALFLNLICRSVLCVDLFLFHSFIVSWSNDLLGFFFLWAITRRQTDSLLSPCDQCFSYVSHLMCVISESSLLLLSFESRSHTMRFRESAIRWYKGRKKGGLLNKFALSFSRDVFLILAQEK